MRFCGCIPRLWNWCLKCHQLSHLSQLFNRVEGLDQLFYIYSCQPDLPASIFLPRVSFDWYLALLQLSHLFSLNILPCLWDFIRHVCSSVWHANPLHCLIVWFGSQSAKHVDTLIAHLRVFIYLSPYIMVLSLLPLPHLISEWLNHFELAPQIGLKWPWTWPHVNPSISFFSL